jgi:predicted Zn-dependent protease
VTRIYPLLSDDGNFTIDVQVARNPEPNAFATLGGKIFINEGLIAEATSSDEVAGVLAHEIEHVHRRHLLEGALVRLISSSLGASGWSDYFVKLGFSRTQEAEADHGALLRLQAAKINNSGLKNFFERMSHESNVPAFVTDHPANRERSEMISRFQNLDTTPALSAEDWESLKQICQ